ncbi:MAG: SIS domain-containing protein [Burkholderiales bacterium]|jgi:D-sedoheptulose 7-phosphate isomerase|nr:SIS domain-containing protein [Burkholderiales bacterium]MBP6250593.1 SIS domain-containing protein [Leptothrix sp. (in: b-proteobacteria)]MBP7518931.1 SIS domain-containing protein [Leptothrix sp. (in: b-proteobacteria)]HQY09868.1 SIS domain-containing protein [Burkholderiaceae bacterium]
MLEQRIQQQFFDSADLKYAAAEHLTRPVADASHALIGAITSGAKVLVCGNGAGAGIAQHLAAQLVGRFERERPGLAALCLAADATMLTALGRDDGFEQLFAKQVLALGHPGDVLVVLSEDGQQPNLLAAVEAAHDKEMSVIALTGRAGGAMASALHDTDMHICVPHDRPARVHELHLLVVHCLCEAVDLQLLGDH